MYVCVQRDENRWRQRWFICLESSFIWGVYYGDFHVSTQEKFICPSNFDMKRRKIIKKRKNKCEPFLFISLILLIVEKFFFSSSFFFAYLFIRHIQPRHWHVIPCWRLFLCVVLPSLSFPLYICRILLAEMMMCYYCDDKGGVIIFVHLCMSSNEMRRAKGYKRKC